MPPKTPRQSGISLSAATTPVLPNYSFGDIVLAKVKGHPAWPARIVDPLVSPLNLRDERKISQKNTYLVKFFKTADYAWMNAKEMSILGTPEIRAFIDNPNKKGADLKAAYQIALAPEAWEAELENFQQEYEEQQKALEVDELEPDETDGVAKAVPLKPKQKRKRPSEVKTPLTSAKKRKSEPRTSTVSAKTSATPEPAASVTVAKKGEKKKKEEVVAPLDGESIVRDWRHKLQRLFLGKTPLTEKMMPEIHEVFSAIEAFEMKSEWLHASKLAKVLKRVGVLDDHKVPLEAQYNIRGRSRVLQDKWRHAFGFPEDSSNRPKVVEGSDENKPEAAANKESEVISDRKKYEPIDTDCQKVMEKSSAPDAALGLDGAKVDVDVAQPSDSMQVEDENMKVKDNSAKLEDDNTKVDDDSRKVENDQRNPPTVDESVPQSPITEEKPDKLNGDPQETPAVTDVPMAAPDDEKSKAGDERPQAAENEDEGEQMDCADSPEPTSVDSNNDVENTENKNKQKF